MFSESNDYRALLRTLGALLRIYRALFVDMLRVLMFA